MNKLIALGVGAAFSLLASAANAALLNGAFATSQASGSSVTPVDATWTATSVGAATGLMFTANGSGYNFDVDIAAIGDFAGLLGQSGTISDFQFNPSLSPNPLDPLWEVGNFKFVADSISFEQDGSSIVLVATGEIIDMNGVYDPTPGRWDFSLNQTLGVLSFSFSTGAVVPEPATLALFGAGLLGLGVLRRRQA